MLTAQSHLAPAQVTWEASALRAPVRRRPTGVPVTPIQYRRMTTALSSERKRTTWACMNRTKKDHSTGVDEFSKSIPSKRDIFLLTTGQKRRSLEPFGDDANPILEASPQSFFLQKPKESIDVSHKREKGAPTNAATRLFRLKKERLIARALEVSARASKKRADSEPRGSNSVASQMSEMHRNHLTTIMAQFTEKEAVALKEEQEAKLREFQESAQQRIALFSQKREMQGVHQRLCEETQNQLAQKVKARIALDQEIRAKSHFLNAVKHENRKLMDNLNYLWGLRGFLDSISPPFFLDKRDADT